MSSPDALPALAPVQAPAPGQEGWSAAAPATIGSQLLLTKLYLPPIRADLVPRPRLLAQITAGLQGPLTLISAPAGFGKTSLFCAWRSSPDGAACCLAWLSLDPDDDEPARFLQYLAGALEGAMPGAFGQVAVLFRLPQLPPIKTVLAGILNCLALAPEGSPASAGAGAGAGNIPPLVLALDDYHVIENPAIHEAVEYLLDHLPPCLRIVILSRSDPPLRLARLRARGQLTEIRAGDLRFTTGESTQFLNDVMRLGLEPADIEALDARTEGWIAGLKLAALRLAQPGLGRQETARFIQTFGTNHRFAAEFLVEEVVSRQPPAVQEFLLRSSIIERMCAPMCDELIRAVDGHGPETPWPSEEVIEHLVRRNLFVVPLDEEGYWYRYHHLFRDLLRARLARLQPAHPPQLHRAASAWFESQGLLKEAVRHALLTQDWNYAADMVERHCAATLGHSDLRTLNEWCTSFPEDVIRRRPVLCIFHAWVLGLSYKDENLPLFHARLAQAEAALAAGPGAPELPERAPLAPGKPPVPLRAWVRGNVTQLRATYMKWPSYPDFDAHIMIDLSRQSMDLLAEAGDGVTDSVNFLNLAYAHMAMGDASGVEAALAQARLGCIEGGNYYGGVTAIYYQAHLAFCRGELDRVEEICAQGRAELGGMLRDIEQNLLAIRSLDLARGCARLERGDLLGADEALRRGLDLPGWAPWVEMNGYLALARLQALQGDHEGMLSTLARIDRLGPHVLSCPRALRLFHRLRTSPGDPQTLAEAAAWAPSVRPDPSKCPPMGIGPFHSAIAYATYLPWAHVMVVLGEARGALAFVEPALALAEQQGLLTRVIELSLVEALARNVLGESRRSGEALERALAIAEHTSHLRTFDQGEQIKKLLGEAAARGVRRQQIRGILDAIGWPAGTPMAGQATAAEGRGSVGAAADPPPVADKWVEPLSQREQEILGLIAAGLSNAEIASRLVIGIGTVKTHVNHLFGKLDACSRTQLLAKARLAGLLGETRRSQ